MKKIVCPLCHGQKVRPIRHYTAAFAARHFSFTNWSTRNSQKEKKLQKVIAELWSQTNCQVYQCQRCQLCFAWPYASGNQQFYELVGGLEYPGERWEFQQTALAIQAVSQHQTKTLLEIGAGSGKFLAKVADCLLNKKNIVATEYYPPARQLIQQMGISCLGDDVTELAKQKKFHHTFDYICAFQVVEHMAKIERVVRDFDRLLKVGGELFISVPNGKRTEFNEQNRAFLDTPPNHVNRFYPATFSWLAKNLGWEVVQCQVEPQSALRILAATAVYRRRQNQIINKNESCLRTILAMIQLLPTAIFKSQELGSTLFVQLRKRHA